jgi:translocation and assembly module TamB
VKRKNLILLIALIILLLVTSAFWVLVSTETGLHWLYNNVAQHLPAEIKIRSLNGRLIGPLRVKGFEYHADGTEVNAESFFMDWRPWALLDGRLEVTRIAVSDVRIKTSAKKTEETSSSQVKLPDIRLPLAVAVDDALVENFSYAQNAQPKPLVINKIMLRASTQEDTILLDKFIVDAPDFNIDLLGKIRPVAQYLSNLSVKWTVKIATDKQLSGTGSLQGDIEKLAVTQEVSGVVDASLQATLRDLLDNFRWKATVDIAAFDPRVFQPQLGVEKVSGQVTGQGGLQQFQTYGRLMVRYEKTGDVEADFNLFYQPDKPEIDQFVLGILDSNAELHLTGNLNMPGGITAVDRFAWDARLKLQDIDPRLFNSELKFGLLNANINSTGDLQEIHASGQVSTRYERAGKVNGDFRLVYYPGRLQVDKLELVLPDSDIKTQVTGLVKSSGDNTKQLDYVDANLQWTGLRWPLETEKEPVVISPAGSGQIQGTLAAYHLQMQAQIKGHNIPPGDWRVTGQGDRDSLNLSSVQIKALDGSLAAHGKLNWRDGFMWDAVLAARDLNPARLWPDWPAKLSVDATSKGRVRKTILTTQVAVEKISGSFRDNPVQGSGEFKIDGKNYVLKGLDIKAGDAHMNAFGSLTDRWNVSWKLKVQDLAALLPDAGGLLDVQGSLQGPRQKPHVQLTMTANKLQYENTFVDAIDAKVDLDVEQKKDSQIDVTVKELRRGDLRINSLTLNAIGRLRDHQIQLTAKRATEAVQLSIAGRYIEKVWHAQFNRADVQHTQFGDWHLNRPGNLQIAQGYAKSDQWCWINNKSRLCADVVWNKQQGVNTTISTDGLPLALLNTYMPPDIELQGQLNSMTKIAYKGENKLTVDADLNLSSGALKYDMLEGKPVVAEFTGGQVSIGLNESGLQSKLNLKFVDNSELKTGINLPGWRLGKKLASQPLEGDVQLDLKQLGFVAGFLKQVEKTSGMLKANVKLGGRIGEPKVIGAVTLTKGSAQVPQLGITLQEVNISAVNEQGGLIEFQGSAKSGEGILRINGQVTLDPQKGWPVIVDIKGDHFEAVNTPEARVLASPDLQLLVTGRRIDLIGTLEIPQASLQPPDSSDAVSVSDDVVFVNKQNAEQQKEEKWQIYTTVRIVLGDKVKFSGFGLEGRIVGNVVAVDEPNKLTTGYGELQVVGGTFKAYKIELQIERGRLMFTGGPMNNPGIDVRATRHIGEDIAGVQVRGTLLSTQLTLFSEPPRDQADILSLLLLGVPVSEASSEQGRALLIAASSLRLSGGDTLTRKIANRFGIEELRFETGETPEQASVVIGKYLGPRLYINYSVGLFEPVNTVRLQYRISKKWILQSETSSTGDGGADFLYTFEH